MKIKVLVLSVSLCFFSASARAIEDYPFGYTFPRLGERIQIEEKVNLVHTRTEANELLVQVLSTWSKFAERNLRVTIEWEQLGLKDLLLEEGPWVSVIEAQNAIIFEAVKKQLENINAALAIFSGYDIPGSLRGIKITAEVDRNYALSDSTWRSAWITEDDVLVVRLSRKRLSRLPWRKIRRLDLSTSFAKAEDAIEALEYAMTTKWRVTEQDGSAVVFTNVNDVIRALELSLAARTSSVPREFPVEVVDEGELYPGLPGFYPTYLEQVEVQDLIALLAMPNFPSDTAMGYYDIPASRKLFSEGEYKLQTGEVVLMNDLGTQACDRITKFINVWTGYNPMHLLLCEKCGRGNYFRHLMQPGDFDDAIVVMDVRKGRDGFYGQFQLQCGYEVTFGDPPTTSVWYENFDSFSVPLQIDGISVSICAPASVATADPLFGIIFPKKKFQFQMRLYRPPPRYK